MPHGWLGVSERDMVVVSGAMNNICCKKKANSYLHTKLICLVFDQLHQNNIMGYLIKPRVMGQLFVREFAIWSSI